VRARVAQEVVGESRRRGDPSGVGHVDHPDGRTQIVEAADLVADRALRACARDAVERGGVVDTDRPPDDENARPRPDLSIGRDEQGHRQLPQVARIAAVEVAATGQSQRGPSRDDSSWRQHHRHLQDALLDARAIYRGGHVEPRRGPTPPRSLRLTHRRTDRALRVDRHRTHQAQGCRAADVPRHDPSLTSRSQRRVDVRSTCGRTLWNARVLTEASSPPSRSRLRGVGRPLRPPAPP
jgi:hypothetical protein